MDTPETKYVPVGDADVAYQVIGTGPPDLLLCYGLGSHIELMWDIPGVHEFHNQLASFSRLMLFDRRGTGASDSIVPGVMPTWEEWTDDMRAVLGAAGSERASIMATADAGPIAILFAALHPEQVQSLVLLNTAARSLRADDYPFGLAPEAADAIVEIMATSWGTADWIKFANPDMANDSEFVRVAARCVRASTTPRTAAAQYGYMLRSLDVRWALPLVQVPTLVLHVKESSVLPIEHGRYLADTIDGARLVELEGSNIRARSGYVNDVAEFLTGERSVADVDRILATVLFSDVVGSTERAAALGDQRWRALLDAHDRVTREQLQRFGGREVKTTGDGFLASFDGPARAIRCAQTIERATEELGIEMRFGIHTGECEVRGRDLGGIAVHIAARVSALAGPREVLVSGTVKDLVVGSGIDFAERGEKELKGVPGAWRLFAVKD
ncbi:MAG: adenylate/guanylate cyclase domain-containing protein [Acidimicrobiales bacterium]